MTDRDRDVENSGDEEPVDDPGMGLPEHIVDAAVRGGTAEDLEVVKIWIEKTQNVNATHTTTSPYHADRTGQTLLYRPPARPLQGDSFEALRIIRNNYSRACRALRDAAAATGSQVYDHN